MAIHDKILNIGGGGVSGLINNVGGLAQSAGSIIKKVKSLTKDNVSPGTVRDYHTNGFAAQESMFRPNFFARMFDEPTYLSFRIEFMFNDPDNRSRNTAYNNESVLHSAVATADYSVMYDYMPEPFLDDAAITFAGSATSNDVSTGKRYSTEDYLDMNLGDHGRAALLATFKMALKDIQENFPFYFQSINGLDKLAEVNTERGMRLGKDVAIELTCLEGIDLKITQLLQLYRKIVWDDVYQRWVLPDMMRYFGMRIYVSEIRLFSDVKNESGQNGTLYDFRNAEVRNMTYAKPQKDLLGTITNTISTATAVSQAFLGTKSVISKALNFTAGALQTAQSAINSITGALDMREYCNNAINEVMPTLCFECHMCEFDIENTLEHISSLSASNSASTAAEPRLRIKVGQVREKQAFPLNKALHPVEYGSGYAKTLSDYGSNATAFSNTDSRQEIQETRREKVPEQGNFIYDDVLNKRYLNNKMPSRLIEYNENLKYGIGVADANTISISRMSKMMQNHMTTMNYSPDDAPQSAASASLFTTAMREAVSIATDLGVNGNIVERSSRATHQRSELVNAMISIGETMNAAADRIYNGPEMKSMAVQGVSDEQRAAIANNTFRAYIDELEKSTATENPVLHAFIQNYKTIRNEEKP